MVHDPRVSQTLARLGGVYRDPSRVDRDASSLLRSSVGNLLRPIAAEHCEDNGETSTVLVLQGTIAIHFRGNTYQLLMDIYLPKGYPNRPPVCFVRLAENMYLKENHRHVGSDGKVYLPYLHEWRPLSHNLVELVVAMSSVFSSDPPVFTRAPNASSSASRNNSTTSAAAAAVAASSMSSSSSSYNPSSSTNSWKQQKEAEERLAREAAEANAAAAAVRKAEAEEKERAEAIQAQRNWEETRTNQIRDQVAQKVRKHLQELSSQCQRQVQNDWKDTQRLTLAKEQKIEPQLKLYRDKVKQLERQCAVAEECKEDIEAWLEDATNQNNNDDAPTPVVSIDDLVQPANSKHAQMLALSAENAAISDALYFLDRALYKGNLSCDDHLRQVRRLAKRQFLVRAHLIKINQVLMNSL